MKIAVDLQALQSSGSRNRGIGRYVQAVLEKLSARPPVPGIDYHFYANGRLPAPELCLPRMSAVRSLPFGHEGMGGTNDVLLKSVLLADQMDAVFLPSPIEMADSVVPDFTGFPVVLYAIVYDLIPMLYPNRYLTDAALRVMYMQRMRNLRAADWVFAISEATRQDAIEHLKLDPERVINISGGVSDFFRPTPMDEKAEWSSYLARKFQISKPFVLYTGGEDWRKNKVGLIKAFAALPISLRNEFQLVIACKLSETAAKEVRDFAHSCGLDSKSSLVLTHFVTDEELRALYGLCHVFVFPSFYEGFGLPLVEAMACGAPVISANNSSLKEIVTHPRQLFDAASSESIAGCMEAMLTDSVFRDSVAGRAVQEAANFTWDAVVDRLAPCMETIRSRPSETILVFQREAEGKRETAAGDAVPSEPVNRVNGYSVPAGNAVGKPRLAFFSPFRPLKSGISDYSEEILPALSDHYDIELYVDDGYHPLVETGREHRIYNHRTFERNITWRRRAYDAVVYQLGNSGFHAYEYAALRRFSGISVLHDYGLSGLINYISAMRPELHVSFRTELIHQYGAEEADSLLARIAQHEITIEDLPAEGIYTNRRVFTQSLGVIVHNRWSYNRAVNEHSNDNECITLIPAMIPPVVLNEAPDTRRALRHNLGIPEGAFVFASFGIVAKTKRPLPTLDAFRQHLVNNPNAFLLFVGMVDMPGVDFDAEIKKRGLEKHVAAPGFVSMATLNDYLTAADVCVALRYPSNGESSAALLRMLVHGKPSIVTNIGSFGDFPDKVVHKLPSPDKSDEVAEIARAFDLLATNAAYREQLGRDALAHVRCEHSPERCARLYTEFIREVMQHPHTRTKMLADYVGREAARFSHEKDTATLFAPFVETLTAASAATATVGD